MSERRRWSIILASAPLWPIIYIFVLASVARLRLGFWPYWVHPDPKELFWPILGYGAIWVLVLAPIGLVISLIVAFVSWYDGRRDWRFLVTPVSFLLLLLWMRFDPGGLFLWWMD